MNICPISRNPQPNIFFDPPCTLKTTNCSLPIFIYLYLVEKIVFRGKSNKKLNESQAGLSYADAPSFSTLIKKVRQCRLKVWKALCMSIVQVRGVAKLQVLREIIFPGSLYLLALVFSCYAYPLAKSPPWSHP